MKKKGILFAMLILASVFAAGYLWETNRDRQILDELIHESAMALNNSKYEEAHTKLLQAKSMSLKIDHSDSDTMITILMGLGNTRRGVRKHQEALKYFEGAKELILQTKGIKSSDYAKLLNAMGITLSEIGNNKEAIALLDQSLKIGRDIGDPQIALTLLNIGSAWNSIGEYEKAVEALNQSLQLSRRTYGKDHIQIAKTIIHLGFAWNELGDTYKAIDLFEQALDILRRVVGNDNYNIVVVLLNIGEAWIKLGMHEEALKHYTEARRILDKNKNSASIAPLKVKKKHIEARISLINSKLGGQGDPPKTGPPPGIGPPGVGPLESAQR
ncbi:MAG: tetratricopeptide repeat protein [Proteobacteria bacterium]|nr:tetratricopeptide repeat protein [Pseudomonadota bacterium]